MPLKRIVAMSAELLSSIVLRSNMQKKGTILCYRKLEHKKHGLRSMNEELFSFLLCFVRFYDANIFTMG